VLGPRTCSLQAGGQRIAAIRHDDRRSEPVSAVPARSGRRWRFTEGPGVVRVSATIGRNALMARRHARGSAAEDRVSCLLSMHCRSAGHVNCLGPPCLGSVGVNSSTMWWAEIGLCRTCGESVSPDCQLPETLLLERIGQWVGWAAWLHRAWQLLPRQGSKRDEACRYMTFGMDVFGGWHELNKKYPLCSVSGMSLFRLVATNAGYELQRAARLLQCSNASLCISHAAASNGTDNVLHTRG
jgi:hypothetical protein